MCLHNQKILHDLVSSQKRYNQWFLSRMWLYSGGKVFNKTESNCWQEVIINKYSKFQVVREMIEFQQSRVIGNNNKSRKQIILIYFFFFGKLGFSIVNLNLLAAHNLASLVFCVNISNNSIRHFLRHLTRET